MKTTREESDKLKQAFIEFLRDDSVVLEQIEFETDYLVERGEDDINFLETGLFTAYIDGGFNKSEDSGQGKKQSAKTENLKPEKAVEMGIIEPVPGKENKYLFRGKTWTIEPEDRISIPNLEIKSGWARRQDE